jgi:hypothetical protein
MELLEELLEPTSFCHAIGHGVILSLGAWSGDDVLALRGPGDELVAKEHNVVKVPWCRLEGRWIGDYKI